MKQYAPPFLERRRTQGSELPLRFLFLVPCNNLLLHVGRYFFVLVEFHLEGAASLGDRTQVGCIVQHFVLGHIGSDLLHAVADGSNAEHGRTFGVNFAFFFSSRRRHTRSLCDWSSDVCSSD